MLKKKVVANADLANTSLAPRRNTVLESWEPLVITLSSPGQYTTPCFMCVYV